MKVPIKLAVIIGCLLLLPGLFSFNGNKSEKKLNLPYKAAGLTERQAAAHLISRFTFGARTGDVDAVVQMGLEKWFLQQLQGNLPDEDVSRRLSEYDALKLSNTEIVKTYPRPAQVLRMAVKDGFVEKDAVDISDQKAYRKHLVPYIQQKGIRPQRELLRQFANQKIVRAVYSNNQLHELLTDFWFNHFNVSVTKRDCAEFIPAYERDVIRPNVTAKFEDLLLATAKSPAMLMYLDNFSSAGTNNNMGFEGNERARKRFNKQLEEKLGDSSATEMMQKFQKAKKAQGLNENYAREVMELHTLGVDGGYSQQDVTEAAKVLTGWTVYPMGELGQANAIKKVIEAVGEDNLVAKGFVHDGDFLFAANRHDVSEKKVLGKTFAADGYNEGLQLLKMLAHHPSTARFISRKIAIRFVNDNPPAPLVDKMAKTFEQSEGDIKQVLLAMVSSPEFWSREAIREKTKSPFELAISAVRSLDAKIDMPYQLYTWIEKMGQKLYFYQAPTGFPDKGQYWINTGSLLNRMNFGLALANNKIQGITINLPALNNNREPESAEDALRKYSKIIMPERNTEETVKRLTPMLNAPELKKKIEQAAAASTTDQKNEMTTDNEMMTDVAMEDAPVQERRKRLQAEKAEPKGDNTMLSQVVGIIIGSPEFQRR